MDRQSSLYDINGHVFFMVGFYPPEPEHVDRDLFSWVGRLFKIFSYRNAVAVENIVSPVPSQTWTSRLVEISSLQAHHVSVCPEMLPVLPA